MPIFLDYDAEPPDRPSEQAAQRADLGQCGPDPLALAARPCEHVLYWRCVNGIFDYCWRCRVHRGVSAWHGTREAAAVFEPDVCLVASEMRIAQRRNTELDTFGFQPVIGGGRH
jgi:hypothetical protein